MKDGNTSRRKYKENKEVNIELKEYMKAEIENGRIQMKQNEEGEIIWECGYCNERYKREKRNNNKYRKNAPRSEKKGAKMPILPGDIL